MVINFVKRLELHTKIESECCLEYTNAVLHSATLHYALHTKLHVVLYFIVVKRCLPI